jgi:8-oxo-dGTP diphosphatase
VSRHIAVVGAVIVRDGLVLCARRGPGGATGGMWEFPGGKIEPGEAPEAALEREILEELGCRVRVGTEVTTTTHAYDALVITLATYWCEVVDGDPVATEHEELTWLAPAELGGLAWAPADVPAVELVRRVPL